MESNLSQRSISHTALRFASYFLHPMVYCSPDLKMVLLFYVIYVSRLSFDELFICSF